MGSWSVYCGISNISITAGQNCVFLPIKKTKYHDGFSMCPATLPIFGSYDDYGGIEEIEQTDNTKLIENHFKFDINTFCHYFTRGVICPEEVNKQLTANREIKNWKFMWIDRKVYDFMTSYIPNGYNGKGDLDFGDPEILKLLGFTYVGINKDGPTYDKNRFCQEWERDGKRFFGDGRSLCYENRGIYTFKELLKIVTVENSHIGELASWQTWKYLKREKANEKLSYILDCQDISMLDLIERVGVKVKNYDTFKNLIKKYKQELKKISYLYFRDLVKFGDGLADLVTLHRNMRCFSSHFTPFEPYITPQCGEYAEHQIFLNKFSEINEEYIKTS